MFESLDVMGTYISIQAILSLYASGRTTGVIMDTGDGVSHIVPVYEGYSLNGSVLRINLAGRDLTEHFMRLMTEKGYSMTTSAEREIAKEVKEDLCYVAIDYDQELKKSNEKEIEKEYTLPDGQVISLSSERFRCPEALFKPNLINIESPGIAECTYDSIMCCTIDLRKDLYKNIVVSGGTSMFQGLPERLQGEIENRAPTTMA